MAVRAGETAFIEVMSFAGRTPDIYCHAGFAATTIHETARRTVGIAAVHEHSSYSWMVWAAAGGLTRLAYTGGLNGDFCVGDPFAQHDTFSGEVIDVSGVGSTGPWVTVRRNARGIASLALVTRSSQMLAGLEVAGGHHGAQRRRRGTNGGHAQVAGIRASSWLRGRLSRRVAPL